MTTSDTGSGDAVFEYGADDREDDDITDVELMFGEDGEDTEVYSPPDRAGASEGFGTTLSEQLAGETLDDRELQLLPENFDPDSADLSRSGALADLDDDGVVDVEKELTADEILGGPIADRSAEEAAIHRIDLGEDEDIAVDEGSTN